MSDTMITTVPPRHLALHEAICRCRVCRGECRRERLCGACKRLDAEIDRVTRGGNSTERIGVN